DRRRGQPVSEAAEILGRDDVVGADHGAAGRVVLYARQPQPRGAGHRGGIDADLRPPGGQPPARPPGGAGEGILAHAGRAEVRAPPPRRRRFWGDGLSASVVVFSAARKPSAARLPPALRIFSLNTGAYSSQWPSPSTTGCFNCERISAGLLWALMFPPICGAS